MVPVRINDDAVGETFIPDTPELNDEYRSR